MKRPENELLQEKCPKCGGKMTYALGYSKCTKCGFEKIGDLA
ncbi:MAG: hypothetical protein ACP5N9_04335 [Candidatus Bilamarchaeum sp.]|jgi:ribosomal protein L37E